MLSKLLPEEVAALREAWSTKGRKLSAAHRAAISAALKGKNKFGVDSVKVKTKIASQFGPSPLTKKQKQAKHPGINAEVSHTKTRGWVATGSKFNSHKGAALDPPAATETFKALKKSDRVTVSHRGGKTTGLVKGSGPDFLHVTDGSGKVHYFSHNDGTISSVAKHGNELRRTTGTAAPKKK